MENNNLVSPRVIKGNRGDILSRWGILSTLLNAGYKLNVFRERDSHIPEPHNGTMAPYGPVYNVIPKDFNGWKALFKSRKVIWTGGLDIQDDSSLVKLMHLFSVFLSYRLMGLKIIAANQGAGPITSKPGRFLTKMVLSLVNTFIARDPGTYKLLHDISPKLNLIQGYDGIFLKGFEDSSKISAAELEAIDKLCSKNSPGQKLIAVNIRLWFHFTSSILPYHLNKKKFDSNAAGPMDKFIHSMTDFVSELQRRTSAKIILLSMYEPGIEPWEDDTPYLAKIKDALASNTNVQLCTLDLSPMGFMNLIGRMNLVVGTRLHSTLTALRLGRPAIHIGYTLKGFDIFKYMGLEKYVLHIEEFSKNPFSLADLSEECLSNSEKLSADIKSQVEKIIAENTKFLEDAAAE